jgi:hypothetical protein
MHLDTTGTALALAVIAHACIGKISGPPVIVNVFAWVMTIILVLVVVFGGLVLR